MFWLRLRTLVVNSVSDFVVVVIDVAADAVVAVVVLVAAVVVVAIVLVLVVVVAVVAVVVVVTVLCFYSSGHACAVTTLLMQRSPAKLTVSWLPAVCHYTLTREDHVCNQSDLLLRHMGSRTSSSGDHVSPLFLECGSYCDRSSSRLKTLLA